MFDRVLVTGGTGFLGRYVLDRLAVEGISPLVTTRSDRAGSAQSRVSNLIQLDITNAEKTREIIDSYRPQAVIHLAGSVGRGESGDVCHEVNYVATTNLLNALKDHGANRVVMFGSAAEYGGQPTPFSEEMPAQPVSRYAWSKAQAADFALNMHKERGLPVTILRVFTAYGFGQPPTMFLPQVIAHALLDRDFQMSDGHQRRDFVYAGDVADAVVSTLFAENVNGRIINIGSGKGIALRDVASTVWKMCRADKGSIEFGALQGSGDDCFDTEADISLAKELLGWHPKTAFVSDASGSGGLADMISQMRNELLFGSPEERNL